MVERVRKRFSRPLSSENMPPRPGTMSMIRSVCFQTSNCNAPVYIGASPMVPSSTSLSQTMKSERG